MTTRTSTRILRNLQKLVIARSKIFVLYRIYYGRTMVMSLSRCTESTERPLMSLMSCITVLLMRTWLNEYGSVMTTCRSAVTGMTCIISYI